MPGKNDNLENALLKLFFNATPIAGIADNAASAPATNITVNLHTADPTDTGTPATSVTTYGGYAAVTRARTTGGWTVTANSVSPLTDIDFPASTGAASAITHASVSIGNFMYFGALSSSITIVNGTVPRILAGSTITEE